MPKEEKEKTKKKMVVVEEVPTEKVEEVSKVDEVPVISETKTEDLQVALNSEPKSDSEVVEEDKPNYLWIIIPTALLIGALVGGLITYFSGLSRLSETKSTPTPVATIAPNVESTPTASPSSTLKKDELKIQVLNGSGVSGAAGKAKTILTEAGYKSIETGNASMSDLAQTEIAIKAIKKEYLDQLIKDLSKTYSAVEAEKPLSTTSKYDIVITIGKK